MPIEPLEPPTLSDPYVKSVSTLPNGDILVTRSGLQTQYSRNWLLTQSASVVDAIFKGGEEHPITLDIKQGRVAAIKNANNPWAKQVKATPPKAIPVGQSPYVLAGTVNMGMPLDFTGLKDGANVKLTLHTSITGTAAMPQTVYGHYTLNDPEDDDVPQMKEDPTPQVSLNERLAPKRVVEID